MLFGNEQVEIDVPGDGVWVMYFEKCTEEPGVPMPISFEHNGFDCIDPPWKVRTELERMAFAWLQSGWEE
jgi:hypothetical protein